MRRSNLFLPTFKKDDTIYSSTNMELALRSGLIHRTAGGLYSYTPTGYKVLSNLINIVKDSMNEKEIQEVLVPSMQPRDIWDETGRWEIYSNEMFTLCDNDGKELCLAPTCEEAFSDLIRGDINSYKQLPLTLFQISNKYRNETIRQGLMRTKEFLMMDAYSFNADKEDLDKSYDNIKLAFINIFNDLNLDYVIVSADSGEMGGSGSEEFLAFSEIGVDKVLACVDAECTFGTDINNKINECTICGNELKERKVAELGHIFKLGNRYTKPMNLKYSDVEGNINIMLMGCYGIGVSRLIPVIIDQNHDDKGIIWPENVAPYKEVIMTTNNKDKNLVSIAENIYNNLRESGLDPLFDDRDISVGIKFKESDLIGIPKKIIIGPKSLKEGKVEIEYRTGDKDFINLNDFTESYLNNKFK